MYRLNYSNGYSDTPGVNITAAFFGSFTSMVSYLSDFLDYFVEQGYTEDKDIRAAPYDWRLSPGMSISNYLTMIILLLCMQV